MSEETEVTTNQEVEDLKAKLVISEAFNEASKNVMFRMAREYGVDNDLNTILKYKQTLNFQDYWDKYDRNEIAAAVVNRISDTSFRGGFIISQGEDEDETEFEKAWASLEKEQELQDKFERADILGLIGRYSGILLGLSDVTDPSVYQRPVSGRKVELMYTKVLAESSMEIAQVDRNPASPRYGMPEAYRVKLPAAEAISPQTPVESTAHLELLVHHTRVIHVSYRPMESEIFGTPKLRNIFNRLEDLEKLVGGAAEMFWRGARPGYQGILDENASITEEGQKAIQEQVKKFESDFTRLFVNKGIELKALAPQVEDPTGHFNMMIEAISAATNIPKRVLMGSERGELASSQDRSNWFETIDARRVREPEKRMIRPMIDRLVQFGTLPAPRDEEYNVVWSDLASTSEKDKIDIASVMATALKSYLEAGADEVLPVKLFFERMGFNEQEIQEIESSYEEMLKKEEEAMANMPEPGDDIPPQGGGPTPPQEGDE